MAGSVLKSAHEVAASRHRAALGRHPGGKGSQGGARTAHQGGGTLRQPRSARGALAALTLNPDGEAQRVKLLIGTPAVGAGARLAVRVGSAGRAGVPPRKILVCTRRPGKVQDGAVAGPHWGGDWGTLHVGTLAAAEAEADPSPATATLSSAPAGTQASRAAAAAQARRAARGGFEVPGGAGQ